MSGGMTTDEIDRTLALLLGEMRYAQVRYSRRRDAFAVACRARWCELMDRLKQA